MDYVFIVFIILIIIVTYRAITKRKSKTEIERLIGERELIWTGGMQAAITTYKKQIKDLGEADKRSMAKTISGAMVKEWDAWYIEAWARNQKFITSDEILQFGRKHFPNSKYSDLEILQLVFALCVCLTIYGHNISPFDLPESELLWFKDNINSYK